MAHSSINLVESIIDEVALEGLDGITLQALWIRLANRFHDPLPLPKQFMEQVWLICKKIKDFSYYKLKTPRESLVMFDRYEFVHPDLGIILEPQNVPPDIYPHCPIQDSKTGVRGSCSTYYTREEIRNDVINASLDEVVEKYGLSLVIVASQTVRTRALVDVDVDPTLEMTIMHYCFLERVGRARYHGEVTQGKLSLSALGEDPKTLYYHRKFLLHHKLITKQVHHQKSAGHCGSGSLLHLSRFYVERKPKMIYLAERVLEILRSKENGVAEYDEIKRKLGIESSIKKLFKSSFFQKIVKTDVCVPYRTLYPNAEPNEWQKKNDPEKEKKIRGVQVLYPDVNIADLWNKDEKDDDEDVIELDVSHHNYNDSYLKQANTIIEASQLEGISQADLGKKMGLTKLQSRSFLRNMVKLNIIATYMHDVGRQRITKYVSKKYEGSSKMSKQFNKEMHRIKQLTKMISENDKNSKDKVDLQVKDDDQINKKSQLDVCVREQIDESAANKDKEKDEDKGENIDASAHCVRKAIELKSLFYTVNRILHKYHLSKCCSKYKCTSTQSLLVKTKKKVDANTQEQKAKSSSSSISKQQIANDINSMSFYDSTLYNSIKTNLIAQKSYRVGKVNEVHGFKEVLQNKTSNVTYRLLKRANMIMEAVKEHQVIDDTTKLIKMIYEEEDKEGYDVKIDKKSLLRLLQKLAKDNLVKNIKLTLSANGIEKNMTFICDPNISTDHTVIKSAIEQAKVKFCLLASQKAKMLVKKTEEKREKEDKAPNDKKQELGKVQFKDMLLVKNHKYDIRAGKRLYGFSPKFIRMRTMHILIFYLVYDHPGAPKLTQQENVELLRSNGYEISDDLVKEFSTIYTTEISWKMFVPPLPKHIGWPDGWALMCDILLGLPLSIFAKVYNISFVIPELEPYMNHPIKKHYLVKNLPVSIRNTILHARKYIYSIHDTVTRLAYIGLVQFGPQRLKDKDQVFIYANRRAELVDTTSTAPSYHKVENKVYPVTKYFFNHTQDVEKYWYDMWTICIATPLGGRLVVHGKDILLEDLSKKAAMVEAITARTPKETVEKDVGTIPGDRQGAAGIDSAFFAHLKRNWNWNNHTMHQQASKSQGKPGTRQRDLHLSNVQVKPVNYKEYDGLKKVSGPPPSVLNAAELRKRVYDHISSIGRKNEALPSHQSTRQTAFVRRVLPRKKGTPRLKYDEDDFQAMQRMHKLRVDWEPHEDNILLVCKVATTYLSPNPRKQVVTFIAMRDVLRTFSYSSNNKTSRACQRRLMYMLKQQRTVDSVTLGVEEIKQDPFVDRRYNGAMDRLKGECANPAEYEKRVTEVFKELVGYIVKKYYDITEIKPKKHMAMPKTAQEFNLLFEVVHPAKPHKNQSFTDVRNMNDIYSVTINSVIHSSMCCGRDRRCWAYQLFKVYQHYPETLLRQAMNKIRSDQMITVKKHHLATFRKLGNYMPMSSSTYQLSNNYIYKLQTKWPYDMFKKTYDVFAKLLRWYSEQRNAVSSPEQEEAFNGTEILPISSGIITTIHDFLARGQIDFDIEMPDQVIMLDAKYQGKDETYFKVAQRYQDILTRLYRFKFENVDAQNTEFPEAETQEGSEADTRKAQEGSLKRKRSVEESDLEKPTPKTARKNEESDERKQEETQNKTLTEEDSVDKSVEHTESKNCSKVGEQSEKNNSENCVSKKRPISEEDSMDCEESLPFLKRARVKSEDSLDLEDIEQNEELGLSEDFESMFGKMFPGASKSLEPVKELKEPVEEKAASPQPNSSTDVTSVPRLVSEIIRNMPSETSYFSPYTKIAETNDQKKYTRIAMLRMREELKDLTMGGSHHAHEYFVVNSFRIFYNLEPSAASSSADVETFKEFSIPGQFLPLRIESVNNLLSELNRNIIFPKNGISYTDYKDEIAMKKQEIPVEWRHVDAVCKFVRERKEIGVRPQELLEQFFNEQGTDLYKVVSLLTENHIFLRSGVTKPRYIYNRYADSWLIHSCKIHRLEHESVAPFKESIYATVPQGQTAETKDIEDTEHKEDIDEAVHATPSTPSDNSEEREEKDEQADSNESNENKRKEDSDTNDENSTHAKKRVHNPEAYLLARKEVYKAAQQLDFTTSEEIKVIIKPWIRVDGILNRKVLDRMLGAVLSYCLLHPGLTMARVQSRFTPALQPFHTRELLEMLIKLGCLESKHLKKTRVTLFSRPATIKLENLTADTVGWSAEDEIILEPAADAILKFSIFLSTKTYSTDFIS